MEDMDEHYTQRVSEIGVDVIHWDPLATSEKNAKDVVRYIRTFNIGIVAVNDFLSGTQCIVILDQTVSWSRVFLTTCKLWKTSGVDGSFPVSTGCRLQRVWLWWTFGNNELFFLSKRRTFLIDTNVKEVRLQWVPLVTSNFWWIKLLIKIGTQCTYLRKDNHKKYVKALVVIVRWHLLLGKWPLIKHVFQKKNSL